ncbi:MAG: hypothetical protein ACE148_10575 [Vicinamibacterales bacterium]
MRQRWSSILVGLGVLAFALAFAGPAYAQEAQQPATPTVTYPADAVVLLHYIQTAKAADYEMVMAKIKEALQKSEKPERRQQAEGWTVFKSPDPSGIDGVSVYVQVIDPVVKGANYHPGVILQEAFPNIPEGSTTAEYINLYNKYSESYNTGPRKLVPINLNLLARFKQ